MNYKFNLILGGEINFPIFFSNKIFVNYFLKKNNNMFIAIIVDTTYPYIILIEHLITKKIMKNVQDQILIFLSSL